MPSFKRYITVPVLIEGVHHYPEAARDYLVTPHHHTFKFDVSWNVTDPNRQIEFHDAKDVIRRCIHTKFFRNVSNPVVNFGTNSCEMLAEILFHLLEKTEYGAPFYVTVSEDDGCSGSYAAFPDPKTQQEKTLWDDFPSFKRVCSEEPQVFTLPPGKTFEAVADTLWSLLETKLKEAEKGKSNKIEMGDIEGKYVVLPPSFKDITFCVRSKEGDLVPTDLRLDSYEVVYNDTTHKAEKAVFILLPKGRQPTRKHKKTGKTY